MDGLKLAQLLGQPCNFYALQAGALRTAVRDGKPPAVAVTTESRRGHNCTVVRGLESYGVDPRGLAAVRCVAEGQPALISAVFPRLSTAHDIVFSIPYDLNLIMVAA